MSQVWGAARISIDQKLPPEPIDFDPYKMRKVFAESDLAKPVFPGSHQVPP